jgi:hypothetical protein
MSVVRDGKRKMVSGMNEVYLETFSSIPSITRWAEHQEQPMHVMVGS